MPGVGMSGPGPGLAKVAATPVAGFALQNATPGILSWTAPNDGAMHRCEFWTFLNVSVIEVGGQVQVTVTPPNGVQQTISQFAAGKAVGTYHGDGTGFGDLWGLMVEAGTTVTLAQTSALTSGAATVWAEIWAS
jgi:hypothetical protein